LTSDRLQVLVHGELGLPVLFARGKLACHCVLCFLNLPYGFLHLRHPLMLDYRGKNLRLNPFLCTYLISDFTKVVNTQVAEFALWSGR
jgi:hypothetical protein